MKLNEQTLLLRAKIITKNMTVDDLSDKTGIKRTTLYRRLKQPESFELWEVRKIVEVLGIKPSEIPAYFF